MTGAIRRIGIGMVGAGQIARDRHVPGFKRIPGVELVAVVNRSPGSSRRAMEEHGFRRAHAHWRDLVADPEVDAVVIGTWPYLHAPITVAALDAGRHVLTEARMAMDGRQARAMLATSLAHPELVAMVVPSPLLWADRTIERLLAEGAVGRLRSASAVWSERWAHGSRLHWRQQVELSGSNVMSLGIVYETMARWLGQAISVQAVGHVFDPVKVRADGSRVTIGVPDHLSLVAEFPGPVLATLEMSTGAAFDERLVHLRGSDGTLRVDFSSNRIELATGAGGYRPVEVGPSEAGEWRVEREFVDAIRGEGEVRLTDFATGAAYMAFTDAVRTSRLEGRRVPIGSCV